MVEPCDGTLGEPESEQRIYVDARGPAQAGQLALGETLSLHGEPDRVRCKVWRLGDDYSPHSVTLYKIG